MRPAQDVPSNKKMTLDQVLTFSFVTLMREKAAYGQWMLLCLVVVLLNLLPVGVFLLGIDFNNTLPFYAAPEAILEQLNGGAVITSVILLLVALLVDLVFAFYSGAWFYRVALDAQSGEERSFIERLGLGMKDLGKLVAPMILLGVFNIVCMVPYYIVDGVMTASGSDGLSGLALIFYAIGMFGSFFLAVKLICAYGLILVENYGVMDAFKESFTMTGGRGWRIFGYSIVIGLLGILLALVTAIPLVAIWAVTFMTDFTPALLGAAIILTILFYLVMMVVQSGINANMTMAVYRGLRIEHSEDEPTGSGDFAPEPPKEDDVIL